MGRTYSDYGEERAEDEKKDWFIDTEELTEILEQYMKLKVSNIEPCGVKFSGLQFEVY